MSDSITRLFPTPPAGSSSPGAPTALADDEQASAKHHQPTADILPFGQVHDYPERARFVRPMAPVEMARATRDEGIDLYRSLAERRRIDRIVADLKHDQLVDRLLTCAVLFVVAAFIGAMLAVGHS